MAAQQFQNADGVKVNAEQITEVEEGDEEYLGFWRLVDKDGTTGRIPDEQFQRNFSPVAAAPAPAPAVPASKG